MKKILIGLVIGFLLGHVVTYWATGPHGRASAATSDAAAKEIPAAEAPEPGTVHLETDDQEKADLKTAHAEPMEYKPEAKGFARVLDPAPLAALLTELTTDQAALDASSKEYARMQTLQASNNASARSLETAEADMKHDQAQVASVKAQLLSDWGKALAQSGDLPQLVNDLLAQNVALIRVDMLGGETLPAEPRELRVAPLLGDDTPIPAEIIGPAPNADPQEQGVAFLALIKQNPPSPGSSLLAWMASAGSGQKGLRLPETAIVRYEGDTFVYVQTNGEDFERWRVKLGPPLRDGVFVTSGVTAQDNVVINAAAQLLSEELKAASGGSD